jgi:hypothetical protein
MIPPQTKLFLLMKLGLIRQDNVNSQKCKHGVQETSLVCWVQSISPQENKIKIVGNNFWLHDYSLVQGGNHTTIFLENCLMKSCKGDIFNTMEQYFIVLKTLWMPWDNFLRIGSSVELQKFHGAHVQWRFLSWLYLKIPFME